MHRLAASLSVTKLILSFEGREVREESLYRDNDPQTILNGDVKAALAPDCLPAEARHINHG